MVPTIENRVHVVIKMILLVVLLFSIMPMSRYGTLFSQPLKGYGLQQQICPRDTCLVPPFSYGTALFNSAHVSIWYSFFTTISITLPGLVANVYFLLVLTVLFCSVSTGSGIHMHAFNISIYYLTSIAGLVHAFNLDLTTQILIFLCQTCQVYATKHV